MVKYVGIILLGLLPGLWMAWEARGLPHLGAYHDDGIYWVTAKSLATGQGYRQIHLPTEPYQTKYPPVYSLMLAPAWWSSAPENVALAITWLGLPALVALSWLLFRRLEFGQAASAILAALVAVNPHSQLSATRLMADLSGAGWLWGCLLLSRRSPVGTGLLAGVAFLTRTAFVPLIVLLPAWYAWRRQWRSAAQFLAASIPMVLGWVWFTKTHTTGANDPAMSYYTSYLTFQMMQVGEARWFERIWTNVGSFTTAVAHLLMLGVGDNPVEQCVRYVLVVATLTGVWRLSQRAEGQLPAAFLAIYSLELLVWYFEANPRFLYPLLPLLLAGFWVEMARFIQTILEAFRKPQFAPRVVAVGLAVLLGYLGLTAWWQGSMLLSAAGVPMLQRERARAAEREQIYQWVRQQTPPTARFYSVHDPVFYLKTKRHAMRSPRPETMFKRAADGSIGPSDQVIQLAKRFNLGYAVLTQADAMDHLAESRDIVGTELGPGFERIHHRPTAVVWQLR